MQPDKARTIAGIRRWHRERCFAMDQRKRLDLATGSFLKLQLGWSRSLPDTDRKRIAARAATMLKAALDEASGKAVEVDDSAYFEWRDTILAAVAARTPFSAVERLATKEMEKLAQTLAVWPWAKGVRGFGPRSLAVIVAEAGDLSSYPKKGHLWKRMGLAVIGDGDGLRDIRQGGLRKGDGAEAWIEHGYNATRRSCMFVIGDALVKQGDEYRRVYLSRKAYERERCEGRGLTVAPAAKIPKAKAAEFVSEGHIHLRAQRYMEKRLLKDLWQAWRRAQSEMPERATYPLPAADLSYCPGSPG